MTVDSRHYRIGLWFIRNIIENTEQPLMAHRGEQLLNKFYYWLLTSVSDEMADYLTQLLNVSINSAHAAFMEENIEMPDGNMYSRSEINYLAICN